MRNFLIKNQITIFFSLTFILSWIPWMITGTGWFIWAPTLIGLLMTAVVSGKKGLRDLIQRTIKWRVGILWYAVVLLVPIIMSLTAVFIFSLTGGEIPTFSFVKNQWYLIPPLFLFVMFFPTMGPVAEEFGWRGYALHRLQELYGPLIASLIIGTAWGLWHLPQFFTPGTSQFALSISLLIPFTISEIAISIFMTWVYNSTKGSILIAGLMSHAAFNFLGTLLITNATMESFTQGAIVLPDKRLILLLFGLMVLFALAIILLTKGRLGFPIEK